MHIKSSPTLRTTTLATGASWRTTAITAALGVLLSMAHLNAHALALGPITSLSALGEPLVASIAVPQITPEEYASLKVTLATPEGFKAAGMEYNPALSSAQFTLNRRPDGTTYLLLRSNKMVADPFLNLVVTAKWPNGQIIRNYTLLLDPPAARQSDASTITAPLTALPPAPAPAAAVAPSPAPRSEPVTAAAPAAALSAPSPAPAVAARPVAAAKPSPVQAAKQPAATPSPAAASKNSGEQVKVAGGDTAGKIAANNRPANVSLDQMLIAMLRGNPDAFIGNNINRLKAGAILSLPTSEEAQAIPDSTARQTVLAQSKDFNDFRRKLAENAPGIASKAPDRQAGGKVEAKVEDRKTAAVTPDKLTLSKGSLNTDPKAATAKDAKDNSEKIAKERQAKDDAARVAELSKNITDLNKIAGATPAATVKPAAGNAPAAPASPAVAATAPTAAGKAAGAVALTAPTAVVAATTPATAAPAATNAAPAANIPATPATPAATGTPAAATPAPATTTATPAAAATPPTTPTVPATPVVVVKVPVPEPSFLDGLMGNPAVLPAAGGLLALLAAGGLYLARKRKNRVEEEDDELGTEFEEQSFFNTTNHAANVHEEALIAPIAVDAHTTALEPTFDLPTMPVAAETPVAQAPMPVPVPVPVPELSTLPVVLAAAPLAATTKVEDKFPDFTPSEFSERTIAQLDPESAKSPASVDLDLDFDFASDFPAAAPSPSPAVAEIKTAAVPVTAVDHHSLDFDMPSLSAMDTAVAAAAVATTAAHVSHTAIAPVTASTTAPAVVANHVAPLDFNMDSLSLDLNANNKQTGATAANAIGPLETKLALAQEFRAIGDATGAKMLAQEVIALASGSLKIKAETLLAEIG